MRERGGMNKLYFTRGSGVDTGSFYIQPSQTERHREKGREIHTSRHTDTVRQTDRQRDRPCGCCRNMLFIFFAQVSPEVGIILKYQSRGRGRGDSHAATSLRASFRHFLRIHGSSVDKMYPGTKLPPTGLLLSHVQTPPLSGCKGHTPDGLFWVR